MASVSKVLNVDRVIVELGKSKDKYLAESNNAPRVNVIVGFTAKYALWVHERVEMSWKGLPRDHRLWPGKHLENPRPRKREPKGKYWDPQGKGQAKFLEAPAREYRNVLGQIVLTAIKRGASFIHALYLAGLRLQREAQLRVPVDTGNLKASAFTRKEI